jgi:hypothetical protein
MPGYHNGIVYKGQRMRNWWEAMYDFDGFIDRGRSLYCSATTASEADCSDNFVVNTITPPTPTPTTAPRQTLPTPTVTPIQKQSTPTSTPTSVPTKPALLTVQVHMLSGDGSGGVQQVVVCFYEYDPSIEPGNDFSCSRAKDKIQVSAIPGNVDGQPAFIASNITLPQAVSSGRYKISLKLLGSVPFVLPFPIDIVTTQPNTVAALLRSGDLNKDGQVNSQDVSYLLTNCYGSKADTGSCNKKAADFNDDNAVNGVDYSMLLNAIDPKNN